MTTTIPQSLLDLLDERPVSRGGAGLGDGASEGGATWTAHAKKAAGPSPFALKMDRWGKRRGEELAAAWNVTHEGTAEDDEGDGVCKPTINPHAAEILADAHAACFEPAPQLAETPADKCRAAWFDSMLKNPDYHALHSQTALDDCMSEIGTKRLADQYAAYVAELTEQEQQCINEGGNESIQSEMKRLRSVSQAVSGATQDVGDAKGAAAGLGMGQPGQPLKTQEILDLFRRIRNDDTLRRIFELAGRYRRVAQSKQRQKQIHGRDDLVGIELAGDVGRMIPAELAMLTIPELELDTLRRIAEREVLCRKYRGITSVAQGPIVCCVDESRSMSGEPIANAKAMALALAWVARHQRRWFALVGFSGGTEGTHIAMPPGKWDQNAIVEWLEHFYGGGTTLDVPIAEVQNVYWPQFIAQGMPRGGTDLILITDAIVSCPDDMRDSFLAWKKREQCKAYGIVIGGEPGDLEQICDRITCIQSLNVEENVVGEVLAI